MARIRAVSLLVVVMAAAWVGAMVGPPAAAQSATELGGGGVGEASLAFVGHVEQTGTLLDDFGYLTSLAGIDEADLFAGEDPLARDESAARIYFFTSAKLQTRSVLGTVFVTAGTGETTFYVSESGGPSFDDPATFKQGTAIATFEGTWQDVVNVQQPNEGVVSTSSDMTQTSATPFTIGTTQYVLGHTGLVLHLTATGQGVRSEPTEPRASIVYGGVGVVAGASGTSGVQVVGGSAGTSGWSWVALVIAILALAGVVVAMASMRRRGG
jgi:hypothetical protein